MFYAVYMVFLCSNCFAKYLVHMSFMCRFLDILPIISCMYYYFFNPHTSIYAKLIKVRHFKSEDIETIPKKSLGLEYITIRPVIFRYELQPWIYLPRWPKSEVIIVQANNYLSTWIYALCITYANSNLFLETMNLTMMRQCHKISWDYSPNCKKVIKSCRSTRFTWVLFSVLRKKPNHHQMKLLHRIIARRIRAIILL